VIDEAAIRLRFEALDPVLDERGRRRFAAAEALAAGRGGVTVGWIESTCKNRSQGLVWCMATFIGEGFRC
jgi:hypothetical protein